MTETVKLAIELIKRRSVTPDDAGCQGLIARRLEKPGFRATRLRFAEVDNLWLTHGRGRPLFVFAGHTDVVPTGPLEEWQSDPFQAEIRDGYLYGRGAADMKSGIAAMVSAAADFAGQYPDHPGTIGLLLTSDEEGPAVNGTRRVMDYLGERQIHIDWCVVGEPSSAGQLADVIRIGRRGSLNGKLRIKGVQGHVAYPETAKNPVHEASAFLAEIAALKWDQGKAAFPPTTFQISNIKAGTGAENVIPGSLSILFNLRFSPALSEAAIKRRVLALLDKHQLDYAIEWRLSGLPFLTKSGRLIEAGKQAIREVCALDTQCSTGGGTSDGRFIAPGGAEVIELGVINQSVHKVNECVKVADLDKLAAVYFRILELLLLPDRGEATSSKIKRQVSSPRYR